eukprot:359459-Chlamydomonas_euryale.AAC.3
MARCISDGAQLRPLEPGSALVHSQAPMCTCPYRYLQKELMPSACARKHCGVRQDQAVEEEVVHARHSYLLSTASDRQALPGTAQHVVGIQGLKPEARQRGPGSLPARRGDFGGERDGGGNLCAHTCVGAVWIRKTQTGFPRCAEYECSPPPKKRIRRKRCIRDPAPATRAP